MNRSTTTNGRVPDAPQSLGGYSAFFLADSATAAPETTAAPGAEQGEWQAAIQVAPVEPVLPQLPPPWSPNPESPNPELPHVEPPQTGPPTESADSTWDAAATPVGTTVDQYPPSAAAEQSGVDRPAPAAAPVQAPALKTYRVGPPPPALGAPTEDLISSTLTASTVLAQMTINNQATLRSKTGVRGALNKVGFHLGLSKVEQRAELRHQSIRRQLSDSYHVSVISVKGGAGRTTTAATLGSTFARLRADRVVAIDANPDFGDLSTRTGRHPYGLNLRHLAYATGLDAFAAVQSYTTTNTADLDVVASAWTSESNEALTGDEYLAGIAVLRRHYNLLIADCGTGVLDSATAAALASSHAVVIVTPATVGGVTGAVATLNWLHRHGLHELVNRSLVAIVHHRPDKPQVEISSVEDVFASVRRPTYLLPYDRHLAEGGPIDLRLVAPETRLAFEELAAALAEGFPTYREVVR